MRLSSQYAPDSAYHQQRRWTHPHSVRCLQTAMHVLGAPASLVDVGCAEGVHVAWARAHGIDAMGIDLAAPDGNPALVRADLRAPVDLERRFEWVLCWEVAEHLPEAAADTLVGTLVRHLAPGGRILFTAAPPGQLGPGHINLQGSRYWFEKFYAAGVTYAEEPTRLLSKAWRTCSPRTPWYGNNIAVFWRLA